MYVYVYLYNILEVMYVMYVYVYLYNILEVMYVMYVMYMYICIIF